MVAVLTAKGVGFRALQQGDFDTTAATGRLFLTMLGAFAEFETSLRRERQMEGISKAKAEGAIKVAQSRWIGPPSSVSMRRDEAHENISALQHSPIHCL